MDNENYTNRPKKRVTKKIARQRRMIALITIILILILGIILIVRACASGGDKDKGKKPGETTTTQTTTAADQQPVITTTVPATTNPLPTADPSDPNSITGLTLDKYSVFVEVGQSDMPLVTMTPASSPNKEEIWVSSDESIAVVDYLGNITGVSGGECTVTVSSKNNPSIYAEVKVTVTDPNQPPSGAAGQTPTAADVGGIQQTNNKPNGNQPGGVPADFKVIEGRTYVNGILVVNKSYDVPADYAPGLDPTVKEQFDKLCEAAKKDGLNIYLHSGFRSYSFQQEIYTNYTNLYGSETADTFSARPGHSEHQTGLAIDVNTVDDSFAGTPEAIWLEEHAHEYGFIIRYPEDKVDITGYKYEPWHIRYLGDEAEKVYRSGLCLEEYLGIDSRYS